ncbi:CHRD domain-containing protein [Pedobacter caeni]|uniref:CHRD domain-containing protein n=1 Tax=Pedobacter caeni TaxID=288992 RepID=A0A1M5EI49_9SPHI|nr:CHRD domain-containing protein [Pedobacter caeni]SHF78938.1 CHRD domain-containing protein [Pedobacter caeni]
MKTRINPKGISFSKPVILFSAICCMLVMFSSCKKKSQRPGGKTTETPYDITSVVNAGSTGSGSVATATLSATYSKSNKTLRYNLRFSGIEPGNINLHLGTATELGTLLANLKKEGEKYTSPLIGTVVLNEIGEKAVLENKAYINIISTRFPAGEIRGQLLINKK